MWLLPVFSPLARVAVRGFYRFAVSGRTTPIIGPVLLVANHPNSLLDPATVAAAAGRPVRFLAKAPLFSDPLVGWLIRGSGAIPVYRRQDDPALLARNDDTFRAAQEALRGGDAVGIFPEGLSHSEPSLAPLRTGAARIALGAAAHSGIPFPILPIGLLFRDKQRFRSAATAVLGTEIAWNDLAGKGEDDPAAVRELTARIDAGLREVTINLERRQDERLVMAAEEIYNAERGVTLPEAERVRALAEVSRRLSQLRAGDRAGWLPVARELASHSLQLETLGLRPHQLSRPGGRTALLWTARQILTLTLLLPPALAGGLLYLIPYRITDTLAHRTAPSLDTEATYKLLVGAVAHTAWTLLLVLAFAVWGGPAAAIGSLLLLPLLAWAAVRFAERWAHARATAQRYIARERREKLLADLITRQAEIARKLTQLRESTTV